MGEDVWKGHIRTIEGFWDSIMDYFDSLEMSSGMKIYQDGMVADGDMGQKIVEDCAKSGSRNYELVSRLLKRGAVLQKTEDLKLVLEERDKLLCITNAKSNFQRILAFIRYKFAKGKLLKKRDQFIANRINETLKSEEKGILFIGASHNVGNGLDSDIKVTEMKDMQKIKQYQQMLLRGNKYKTRFEELGKYLVSEVKI